MYIYIYVVVGIFDIFCTIGAFLEYLLLSRHYIMCHDSREDPEICAVIQATHVCTNRGNYG